MSIETTRTTIRGYLEALVKRGPFADYLAEDVVFTVMGGGQVIQGRAAVEQFIRWFHEQAFDARPEIKAVYEAGEHATLEAEFVGRHIGEFFGVAASQHEVRVPYVVVYDVRANKITALRFYMPMNVLMEQIRAVGAPALAHA
jgi:ketosteroid isomerase-like protein